MSMNLNQTTILIEHLMLFSFLTQREKLRQLKSLIEIQIFSITKMKSSQSSKFWLENLSNTQELKLLKNSRLLSLKSIRKDSSRWRKLSLWKLKDLRSKEPEEVMRLIEETHKWDLLKINFNLPRKRWSLECLPKISSGNSKEILWTL